jgi:hypothetical protein
LALIAIAASTALAIPFLNPLILGAEDRGRRAAFRQNLRIDWHLLASIGIHCHRCAFANIPSSKKQSKKEMIA